MERVSITPSDSLINPYEFGFSGSRGTWAVGSAAIGQPRMHVKKLFELAAPLLDTDPGELETIDGMIFSRRKPEKKIPWKAAMGVDRTITGYGRFEPDNTLTNMMMTFVEVEVDTETGKVSLVRVVNTTDIGQIIDPQGLEGPAQRVSRLRGHRQCALRGNGPRPFHGTYAQCQYDRLQVAHRFASCRRSTT